MAWSLKPGTKKDKWGWGDWEMGRWGDGEMGRWSDGAMERWGEGEMGIKRL